MVILLLLFVVIVCANRFGFAAWLDAVSKRSFTTGGALWPGMYRIHEGRDFRSRDAVLTGKIAVFDLYAR